MMLLCLARVAGTPSLSPLLSFMVPIVYRKLFEHEPIEAAISFE